MKRLTKILLSGLLAAGLVGCAGTGSYIGPYDYGYYGPTYGSADYYDFYPYAGYYGYYGGYRYPLHGHADFHHPGRVDRHRDGRWQRPPERHETVGAHHRDFRGDRDRRPGLRFTEGGREQERRAPVWHRDGDSGRRFGDREAQGQHPGHQDRGTFDHGPVHWGHGRQCRAANC